MRRTLLALLVGIVSASAMGETDPVRDNGEFLIDARGGTLFVHGPTYGEVLHCDKACERIWPPFIAPSAISANRMVPGVGVLRRRDGRFQWSYHGQALHHSAGTQGSASPPDKEWTAISSPAISR
jgi:predicted lipoprotein with Yx(FWY)xxD motif